LPIPVGRAPRWRGHATRAGSVLERRRAGVAASTALTGDRCACQVHAASSTGSLRPVSRSGRRRCSGQWARTAHPIGATDCARIRRDRSARGADVARPVMTSMPSAAPIRAGWRTMHCSRRCRAGIRMTWWDRPAPLQSRIAGHVRRARRMRRRTAPLPG
jgi:hypothetical protein